MSKRKLTLLLFFLCGLTNCGRTASNSSGERVDLDANPFGSPASASNQSLDSQIGVSCTAMASPSTVNAYSTGMMLTNQTVTITVTVIGGKAPFSIPGTVSAFNGIATITGGYRNETSDVITVNRTIGVQDSNGHTGSCSFSVNVLPESDNSPTNTCQITAPTQLTAGQAGQFSVSGTGPGAPFAFGNLNFDGGFSAPLTSTSETSASNGAVTLTRPGSRSVAVSMLSAGKIVANCTTQFEVTPSPYVALAASPQLEATVNQSVMLLASAQGFPDTAALTYSASPSAGVTVTPTTWGATVTSTQPGAVKITATANDGTYSATSNLTFTFYASASSYLQCALTTGNISNNSIPVTVIPASPVTIQSVNVGPNSTASVLSSGMTFSVSLTSSSGAQQVAVAATSSGSPTLSCHPQILLYPSNPSGN